MTIDERFARIEHVTDDLAVRVDSIATHLETFIEEAASRDRLTDQRFRETDARIDKLISAMGEFLRSRG